MQSFTTVQDAAGRAKIRQDAAFLGKKWKSLRLQERRHLVATAIQMWAGHYSLFTSEDMPSQRKRILLSQVDLDLLAALALRMHTVERSRIGALILETANRSGELLDLAPAWSRSLAFMNCRSQADVAALGLDCSS